MNILIVGVGNPYRHDDGVGPEMIKILRAEIANATDKKTSNKGCVCDLLDAGTDALALVEVLKGYARAIIIDAVEMRAPPGTIKVFSPAEAKIKINSDALSTHGFGLAEMLKLLEQLEIRTDVTVIGIQPVDISYGAGLSAVVASKKKEIKNIINELIA